MGSYGIVRSGINWSSRRAFRSRRLAELLFGIKFLPVTGDHYYFDASTVVTTRYLRRRLRPDQRVVDMGTGTAAAVGLFLWKHVGCSVVSVDLNPKMVRMSTDSVRANGAPIQVVQSDLFTNVAEPFDAVVFNPPYVPTRVGEERRMGEEVRSQWDGGPEGTDVIEAFLAALVARPHPAVAYLGINNWHVEEALMRRCIAQQPALELRSVYRHWALPILVYVVEHRGAAATRAA